MDDLNDRLARLRKLTTPQRRVLRFLCAGMSQAQIAERLGISDNGVVYHVRNIHQRLGIKELRRPVRHQEIGKFCLILPLLDDTQMPPPEEPDNGDDAPLTTTDVMIVQEAMTWALVPTAAVRFDDEVDDDTGAELRPPDIVIRTGRVVPEREPRRIWQALAILIAVAVLGGLIAGGTIAIVLSRNGNDPPAATPTSPVQAQVPATPTSAATVPTTAVATASPATTVRPTPPPTPTPVPPGTVLYEANASMGFAGWPSLDGWKLLGGMLLNDGTSVGNWAYAPVDLAGHPDYAVEAEIQIVDTGCPRFGIVVRDGYWAGLMSNCGPEAFIRVMDKGGNTQLFNGGRRLAEATINPGKEWHRYRVEVKGNTIRLLVDGALMLEASDNRYLSPGKAALWSDHAQINVRSFKIIKL